MALTLDAVELLARGLEEFDNSGTDLSTPTSTSCSLTPSTGSERKWEVGEELRDVFSTVSFDGVSGPISFANGARSKVHVNILKLGFNKSWPKFLHVGNWSEGISYEIDGLRMGDKIHLTNEKPSINKTLIITTTDVRHAKYLQ